MSSRPLLSPGQPQAYSVPPRWVTNGAAPAVWVCTGLWGGERNGGPAFGSLLGKDTDETPKLHLSISVHPVPM